MAYKTKKQKAYAKQHYLQNKEKYAARDKRRKDKLRKFVRRYKMLSTVVCLDCGESRWQCLEFHHRNPKEKSDMIVQMITDRVTIEKLKEEIKKCDVLCANCHRVRHYNKEDSHWIK